MKISTSILFAASFAALAATAHAQIVFGPATAITGSDNIITAGTYVDALQTGDGKSALTIGDNVFNEEVSVESAYPGYPFPDYEYISSLGDGTIVFSPSNPPYGGRLAPSADSFAGAFTTGNATDNATFANVLAHTTYNGDTFSDVTLNNLTAGDLYEVQVFKADADASRNTVINGTSMIDGVSVSQELDGAVYSTGTFLATSTSQAFTFAPGVGGNFGEISDVVLRDVTSVPEPSTYALLFGGLGLLVLVSRFRGKLIA